MPTDAARDIVNTLFAGQKDLSQFVATGMNALAIDSIENLKKEVGAKVFQPEVEDNVESETETTEEEETTDEADQGGN